VKQAFFAYVNHARICPGINQYYTIRVNFLLKETIGSLWWGLSSCLTGIHWSRVRRTL